MDKPAVSEKILELCAKVRAARPKRVIDHIIAHGFVTTEELREQYGYDHPPRARMDVIDNGVPIESFRVKNRNGHSIAAYRFGNPDEINPSKLGGRVAFSKQFKNELLDLYDSRCATTGEKMEGRYLQIDHRVPYQISGDVASLLAEEFMLLDASAQRSKSWSCEHCENFTGARSQAVCSSCFWARPDSYSHVATVPIRRIDLEWRGAETARYDELARIAHDQHLSINELIKMYADKLP